MSDLPETNIVARAYQLARSGTCSGIEDIRRRLMAEGFHNVPHHLGTAPALKKSLSTLCVEAQGKQGRPPPPGRRGGGPLARAE
jgi:hypothetical protein